MSITDSFLPLKAGDLSTGKPLPWPVYGPGRKLLQQEGFVIETTQQVEK